MQVRAHVSTSSEKEISASNLLVEHAAVAVQRVSTICVTGAADFIPCLIWKVSSSRKCSFGRLMNSHSLKFGYYPSLGWIAATR